MRLAVGLLLLCNTGLSGLSPEKAPEQFARAWWTRVDGLPQSAVQAIARSDPGYLWIGTQDGLARYNGNEFLVFRAENTPALRSDFITSLRDGGEGRLWVGTRQGLVLFDGRTFRHFGSAQGLGEAYVRSLAVDGDHRVWIGTSGGGLFTLDPRNGDVSASAVEATVSPVIRALLPAGDGSVWVGGSEGLHRVNVEGALPIPAETLSAIAQRSVRALASQSDGTLWVGLDDGTLIRSTGEGALIEREDLGLGGISALQHDRHGSLWVAAARGVVRRLPHGAWHSLTDIEPRTAPAYALFEDRGGSLWVGLRHGLLRLGDGSVTVYGERQGLADSFVRVVRQDQAGRLWVGTAEGLSVRLPGDRDFRGVALPPAHLEVRALWSEGDEVYVGSRSGVLRATIPAGRSRPQPEWTPIGPANVTVGVILRDPRGRLWIGTQGDGLLQLDSDGGDQEWRDVLRGRERAERVVRALAWQEGDQGGRLWIGSEGGLLVWQAGATTPLRLTPTDADPPLANAAAPQTVVLALHVDATGDLWLGTVEYGIARLRGREQTWFDHRHGLFDDLVFRILEDREGDLWMTGNRGISVVPKAEFEAVAEGTKARLASRWFDESDGLLDAECNGGTQPSGWIDDHQQLWVPTVDGLARIDVTKSEIDPADLVAVWVEQVLLNGSPLEPDGSRFVVPPGQRNLEVRYASAGHLSSAQSSFQYRLEGFDDRWVDAGSRRSAFFTNLPPGDFSFEVRAISRFGTARDAAPISIDAPPTLLERRTFWWSLALCALLAVFLIGRWRVRSLRQQQTRLRQLVEQRTQELATAMQDLERLASHDALTGLANPRRLHEHLASEWSRAQRSGLPISCLMIDVDHFKQINDRRGHAAGDEVLVTVAGALRLHVRREGELLARRGGDEFVVVLPGSSLEEALRLAEAMRRQVEADVAGLGMREAWPVELNATVSIGVACTVATHGEPPTRLLDLADEAAYRAKWEGRNQVSR